MLRCWHGGKPPGQSSQVSLHVVDSFEQILIGDRAHLIEFPSLLLPPGVSSGSIVNIAVHRNVAEEKRQKREFWELQDKIFETFGMESPIPPELQVGDFNFDLETE